MKVHIYANAGPQTVRVNLGTLKWVLHFQYAIDSNGQISKGTGIADLVFDTKNYFIKQLMSTQGQLEWNPTLIN